MWILSILLHKKAHIDKSTAACCTDMPTTIHTLVVDHRGHLSGTLQNTATDSTGGTTVTSSAAPLEPVTAETESFQRVQYNQFAFFQAC